jgi:hypothetical protein
MRGELGARNRDFIAIVPGVRRIAKCDPEVEPGESPSE